MPLETRLFVKTSLLWLGAAFVAGGVMLIFKAFGFAIPSWSSTLHAHMAFVGWLVNLVIGIALWFLPVNRTRFPNNRGRYPIVAVRWVYGLLNAGLLLRLLFEPLIDAYGRAAWFSFALSASAVSQVVAVAMFCAIAWQRVREV
jgi:hypothetical protein